MASAEVSDSGVTESPSSSSTTTTPAPAAGGGGMDAQMRLGRLYRVVLREVEDESDITEIDADLYRSVSEFLGDLGRQRYDGVGERIRGRAIASAFELVSLLLRTRLEKASRIRAARGSGGGGGQGADASSAVVMQRLLDEEKFILDADEERAERQEIVLSAARRGRSRLLESISENHKTGRIVVRFLQDSEPMVGVDMEMYGPFRAEDIATIPHENAQALISESVAVRVRWEDAGGRRL